MSACPTRLRTQAQRPDQQARTPPSPSKVSTSGDLRDRAGSGRRGAGCANPFTTCAWGAFFASISGRERARDPRGSGIHITDLRGVDCRTARNVARFVRGKCGGRGGSWIGDSNAAVNIMLWPLDKRRSLNARGGSIRISACRSGTWSAGTHWSVWERPHDTL